MLGCSWIAPFLVDVKNLKGGSTPTWHREDLVPALAIPAKCLWGALPPLGLNFSIGEAG